MAALKRPEPPSVLDSLNINISAYRVLYILLVLVQYRSLNTVELNRLLFENPLIQRIYNNETLTKYINTLREVGCDIPRSTSRNDYNYELVRSPFPLSLEPDECEIAEKLLQLLMAQPDDMLLRDYREFLEALSWSVSVECPLPESDEPVAAFPHVEARRQQLQTYRGYCRDAFTLQVRYQDSKGCLQECQMEPHDLVERGRRLMLLGVDSMTQESVSVDVDAIEHVRQLPAKNRRQSTFITVEFVLYGRLARSYRLYPDEKVVYRRDGETQIKAKVSETSALMNRLLKYGASCRVLAPASLCQEMRQRIGGMLDVLNIE